MIAKITKAADKVRKWCVRNRSIMPITLKGMCAIASFKLSCELDKHQIDHKIVVTDSHVWIYMDGIVIDITASQFTDIHQPLIIDSISYEQMFCKKWKIPSTKRIFRSRNRMVEHLIKSGWPKFQIPSL